MPEGRTRVLTATAFLTALAWVTLIPCRHSPAAPAPVPAAPAAPTPTARAGKPADRPADRAADKLIDKSFRVPVLSVARPGNAGSLRRVEFALTRRAAGTAEAPLTVSVAEDTPGGAGEGLRASVWAAVMVAALDRADDLSGVRVSLQLPGQVDGGSAGGVVCLAVMTALDGRDLPSAFAMTGTVMPDGTIGQVAGIAPKLRAAAAAGVRRVLVPANVRFEKDEASGAEVDLKRLAASLGVELVPVENVARAYEAAHRLPRRPQAAAGREALDLPVATEELLKTRYREDVAAAAKLWDAIPEPERARIAKEPLSRQLLVEPQAKAEVGYRSGRLLYAADTARAWRLFLEARAKNQDLFRGLKGQDFRADMGQLDAKFRELAGATPTVASLVEASQKAVPDAGVQLCAGYHEAAAVLGMAARFQAAADDGLAELDRPENKGQERQDELRADVAAARAAQLLLARCAGEAQATAADDAGRLAATLPQRRMAGDAPGVERLFYSAYLAAHNAFEADVVRSAAAQLGVGNDQALAAMAGYDPSLVTYLSLAASVHGLHRELADHVGPGGRLDPRFAAAAAAHGHARALASVGGLIARWGELEPEADDRGQLRYGRTDLLNYLLSAARENALASIAECRVRGIPCVQPLSSFEAAELGRDDTDEDKVNVLANYWDASLQAKALLMLFAGGGKAGDGRK